MRVFNQINKCQEKLYIQMLTIVEKLIYLDFAKLIKTLGRHISLLNIQNGGSCKKSFNLQTLIAYLFSSCSDQFCTKIHCQDFASPTESLPTFVFLLVTIL